MASEKDLRLEELKRESSSTETSFKNEKDPSKRIEMIMEYIDAVESGKFGTEVHIHYFISIFIPKVVTALLRRNDFETLEIIHKVNQLLQSVLRLGIRLMPRDNPDLCETISKIFFPTSNFYLKHTDPELQLDPESQKKFLNPAAAEIEVSSFFVANIVYFAEQNGFTAIVQRLSNPNPKVLIYAFRHLIKSVIRIREFLPPQFMVDFVNEIRPKIFELLMNLTYEELKKYEESKTFFDLIELTDSLMRPFFPEDTSQTIETFTLEFCNKLFKSNLLEKKIASLTMIRETFNNIYRKMEYQRKLKANEPLDPTEPSFDTLWTTPAYLIQWIRSNLIIEQIFQDLHPEMIKRATEILKYFASQNELDTKTIDMIWDSANGKHESVIHTVYSCISDMTQCLSPEGIDHLNSRMREVPYSQYDAQTMLMWKTFSYFAFLNPMNIQAQKKKQNLYGLEVFWELLQEEVKVADEIVNTALDNLAAFLGWTNCLHLRTTFIELILQKLHQHKSVANCYKFLVRILNTFPDKPTKPTDMTAGAYIEWLDQTQKIIELFFEELEAFKKNAHVLLEKNALSPALYTASMKDRLDFLEFFLGKSPLVLTEEMTERFWEVIIAHPAVPEEQDLGFMWLENARGMNYMYPLLSDEATELLFAKVKGLDIAKLTTKGFGFFEFFFRYLNWRNMRFRQAENGDYVILSTDLIGLTLLWDIAMNAIDPAVGKQAISTLNCLHKNYAPELKQFENQQRQNYIATCMTHISDAYKQVSLAASNPNLSNVTKLHRCLQLLKTFIDEFKPVSASGLVKLKIALFQGQGSNNKVEVELRTDDTIGKLKDKLSEEIKHPAVYIRLITAGTELKENHMTIGAAKLTSESVIHLVKRPAPKDETPTLTLKPQTVAPKTETAVFTEEIVSPNKLLAKQEYFEQLFLLLNLEPVAQKAWDLLMLLPRNEKIFQDVVSIQNNEKPDWNRLLDSHSTFALYYSLQIVESMTVEIPIDNEEVILNKRNWKSKFLERGGLGHLMSVLMSTNFSDKAKGNKRKTCLALLLRITNLFLFGTETDLTKSNSKLPLLNSSALPTSVNPDALCSRLLELVTLSAETSVKPAKKEVSPVVPNSNNNNPVKVPPTPPPRPLPLLPGLETDDSLVCKQATQLLAGLLIHDPKLFTVTFVKNDKIHDWLRHVLFDAEDRTFREHIVLSLCQVVLHFGTKEPRDFFFHVLLKFLPQLEADASTCEQYFEFLNTLVDLVFPNNSESNQEFCALLFNVVNMIQDHPIVELRFQSKEDNVLIGLLHLAATMLSKAHSLKLEIGSKNHRKLINHIFNECLFRIPTQDNHGAAAPPKCKTPKCRRAAFKLLAELCAQTPENFLELSDRVLAHHPIDEKRSTWHYAPSNLEKASVGFVGLRNLGATCYMNSLMQQFFMVPQFRQSLLSIPLESEGLKTIEAMPEKMEIDEVLKDNIMYQIQKIFSQLQESEKKFGETKDFCRSYKYDGQPINPLIQMDADEFFNMLFDRLENLVKNSPSEQLFKDFFGGTVVNQIIGNECGHISEREENFFTVSVEIKNKKNILESLDLYVKGDVLEGDNKYFCSTCQAKVNATKRCCIQKLPDNLIIHAKRFEFDLEQMKRVKVNDYCEFPETLNMEAFTKEGLAKKEGRPVAQEDQHPPSFYDYELAGVLVHMGTADSGHYYSFIRERVPNSNGERRWLQFNDTDVEVFDMKKGLAHECFGGTEFQTIWENNQWQNKLVSKSYSAYMLFYQRAHPLKTTKYSLLGASEQSKVVPRTVYKQIWQENMHFLFEKNLFDQDYFQFVWKIATTGENMENKEITFQAIQLATRFIFITLAHAKEKYPLKNFTEDLKKMFSRNLDACRWFLNVLMNDNSSWLRQLLFHCTVSETREILARLIDHVIGVLVPHERAYYGEEDETIPMDTVEEPSVVIEEVQDVAVAVEEPVKQLQTATVVEMAQETMVVEQEHGETNVRLSSDSVEIIELEDDDEEERMLNAAIAASMQTPVVQQPVVVVPQEVVAERPNANPPPLPQRPKPATPHILYPHIRPNSNPKENRPLKVSRQKSLVLKFIDNILDNLLPDAYPHWREYAHFFLILFDFANLGHPEREYLVKRQCMARLIDFYMGEDSPLYKSLSPITRNSILRPKMGDKLNTPPLLFLVETISILARACANPITNQPTPYQLSVSHGLVPPDSLKNSTEYSMLEMTMLDKDMLLYTPFYANILKDQVDPSGISEIARQLSWDNDQYQKFIDVCTAGVNMSDSSKFKAYFEVFHPLLFMQDTHLLHRNHYGILSFMKVINDNIKFRAETSACLKFILEFPLAAATSPVFETWRTLLFDLKHLWVEHWFMFSTSENVRALAGNIVQMLVPEFPVFNLENSIQLPKDFTVQGSETAVARMREVYGFLLTLLPNTVKHWPTKGDLDGKSAADLPSDSWKCVQYFRLLRFYLSRGPEEKAMASQYVETLFDVFLQVDGHRHACDEAKKELLLFWSAVMIENPEAVKKCLASDKIYKIFDFFISVSPNERYRNYNAASLPSYYTILHLFATLSTEFMEKLSMQGNFDFAVKHLCIESTDYQQTCNVIFDISKKIASNNQTWRAKTVHLIGTSKKYNESQFNTLRFLDISLKTQLDMIKYCQAGGLEQLSLLVINRTEKEEGEYHLNLLESTLELMARAGSWMFNNEQKPVRQAVTQAWPAKMELTPNLFTILKAHPQRDKLFTMAARVLAILVVSDYDCFLTSVLNLHNSLGELVAICRDTKVSSTSGYAMKREPMLMDLIVKAMENGYTVYATDEHITQYASELIDLNIFMFQEHSGKNSVLELSSLVLLAKAFENGSMREMFFSAKDWEPFTKRLFESDWNISMTQNNTLEAFFVSLVETAKFLLPPEFLEPIVKGIIGKLSSFAVNVEKDVKMEENLMMLTQGLKVLMSVVENVEEVVKSNEKEIAVILAVGELKEKDAVKSFARLEELMELIGKLKL